MKAQCAALVSSQARSELGYADKIDVQVSNSSEAQKLFNEHRL